MENSLDKLFTDFLNYINETPTQDSVSEISHHITNGNFLQALELLREYPKSFEECNLVLSKYQVVEMVRAQKKDLDILKYVKEVYDPEMRTELATLLFKSQSEKIPKQGYNIHY